jgi:hypothetical protein
VTVDNLTVCNFLAGAGGGNEVWFNGGDGSDTTNMGGFTLLANTPYYAIGASDPP